MAEPNNAAPKPKARDLNQQIRYTMWSVFRVRDRLPEWFLRESLKSRGLLVAVGIRLAS